MVNCCALYQDFASNTGRDSILVRPFLLFLRLVSYDRPRTLPFQKKKKKKKKKKTRYDERVKRFTLTFNLIYRHCFAIVLNTTTEGTPLSFSLSLSLSLSLETLCVQENYVNAQKRNQWKTNNCIVVLLHL